MDTFIQPAAAQRTGRHLGEEFKAQISACRPPGESVAAVALANWLNASLVRRWMVEYEGCGKAVISPSGPASPQESPPTFVPLEFAQALGATADMRRYV